MALVRRDSLPSLLHSFVTPTAIRLFGSCPRDPTCRLLMGVVIRLFARCLNLLTWYGNRRFELTRLSMTLRLVLFGISAVAVFSLSSPSSTPDHAVTCGLAPSVPRNAH